MTGTGAQRNWFERYFWLLLAVVVLAALAWRVLYVTQLATKNPGLGDGFYFHQQANLIADGHGFSNPWIWWFGKFRTYRPAAVHPPLYPLVLSVPSFFGGTTYLAHKLTSCLLGTGAVLVIGLVGRRVGGARAGVLAAVIAAAYPDFWIIDGLMLSEGLFALLTGLVILAAYRFRARPTWGRIVLLGGAIGLAALCRGEAIFLSLFLVVPLVLMTKGLATRRRVGLLALGAVGVVVVISPWVVRNLTTFEQPFFLSSNSDAVLRVANCPATYDGPLVGYYSITCGGGIPGMKIEESLDAKDDRRHATDFIFSHKGDIPRVMVARIGRVWDVYHPIQNARLSTVEGRPPHLVRPALYFYWAVLGVAAIGGVVLYRRRVTLIPLVAQLVMVTFIAASAYGAVRFRIPAEVALIVLAGVALDAGLGLVRRAAPAPVDAPVEGPQARPVDEDRMSRATHP